jgi:hypothetical protein
VKKNVLGLLFLSGWLLLGVSWMMSVYAYARLPQKMALWLSLWKGEAVWTERSLLFFLFPVAQTFFFFGFLLAAKKIFLKKSRPDIMAPGSERMKAARFFDLKKEVLYLALIFINLTFIHLQTSLILVSHGLARGVNRFYFFMLIGVLLILIPYYYARGKMLLREKLPE